MESFTFTALNQVAASSSHRPMGWAAAVAAYLMYLRAAGRAPGTVRLHRFYLGVLAEQRRSPWSVTLDDLLAFLSPEHWQPETRKSARSVVRGFYGWAHRAGHLADDPSLGLPGVRVPIGKPRPTPEHLVGALLDRELEDPRLVRMAMLAAFLGLRVSEIARVHGSDVTNSTLLVHGKGGKDRAVPIECPPLLAWLEQLGDRWAFPNGLTGSRAGHLTPGHVSRLLSRALPGRWTAHTLRHRMGTVAHQRTRNLLAVKEVLGHSRLETTQRYVLGDDASMREVVAAAVAALPRAS